MDAASAPGANPTLADVRFEQYVDEETQVGLGFRVQG
jgi:hypothetical protein